MKKLLMLFLCILPIVAGCSHNYFNVPQDTFADKVKVLGVVPIVVDTDSDIRHPQKEELVAMVTTQNRIYEKDLVRLIKATNSFYTVVMLDADPKALFSSMLYRRERRDDGGIQYNKYFWKDQGLQDLVRKNNLDAVMFVVVSGVNRPAKLYSSNLLDSVEGEFNFLIMTAQIVDAQGVVLWEYPNFRKRSLSYNPLINLQYPAFDEAKANMSSRIEIKFKTLEGIKRSLDKRRLDLLRRETAETELYMDQFEEMASMIEIDRNKKPAPPQQAQPQQPQPAVQQPVKPVQPVTQPSPSAPAQPAASPAPSAPTEPVQPAQPENPLTAPAPKPITQPKPTLNPMVKEF